MRNINRNIIYNNKEEFRDLFDARAVKYINHYSTPILKHPTEKQLRNINIISHIWTYGDRFYKLAAKHYGKPDFWWVIPWYNQRPTENHFQLGDIVDIPVPLDEILQMIGY